jgi:hypothetical protein
MYILFTLMHWLCLCIWRLMLDANGWPARGRRRSRRLLPCCRQVTGLRLHLDLQKIQQWELEFVTRCSHAGCLLLQGPAVLADGCLSGRTTADCRLPVHTLLTLVPQREAHRVWHVCYVDPPDRLHVNWSSGLLTLDKKKHILLLMWAGWNYNYSHSNQKSWRATWAWTRMTAITSFPLQGGKAVIPFLWNGWSCSDWFLIVRIFLTIH